MTTAAGAAVVALDPSDLDEAILELEELDECGDLEDRLNAAFKVVDLEQAVSGTGNP